MTSELDAFFGVLTVPNLISSIVTGMLVGAFIIWPLTRVLDKRPPLFGPVPSIVLFFLVTTILLLPFYTAQTITEAATGASWPRVIARFVVLLAYVGASAVAYGVRLKLWSRAVDHASRIDDNDKDRKGNP